MFCINSRNMLPLGRGCRIGPGITYLTEGGRICLTSRSPRRGAAHKDLVDDACAKKPSPSSPGTNPCPARPPGTSRQSHRRRPPAPARGPGRAPPRGPRVPRPPRRRPAEPHQRAVARSNRSARQPPRRTRQPPSRAACPAGAPRGRSLHRRAAPANRPGTSHVTTKTCRNMKIERCRLMCNSVAANTRHEPASHHQPGRRDRWVSDRCPARPTT
jgi:hypothetical protein